MDGLNPITRKEVYLAAITGMDVQAPSPVTRLEFYLSDILNGTVSQLMPLNRVESYLAKISGADVTIPVPVTRLEFYLAAIAVMDVDVPDPETREELFLAEWAGSAEHTYGPAALVSFEASRAELMKSLLIAIQPVQSGSGTPSPDNVRPISGRTGANAYVSPTQDVADATTYPVTWQADVGTVYGGTVDVVTGELTQTMVCVDLGTLSWQKYTSGENYAFYAGPRGINRGVFGEIDSLLSSYEIIPTVNRTNFMNNGLDKTAVHPEGGASIYIKDSAYTEASAFKTAVSGVQLAYTLAEPITYQLTPQEVQTLVGTNNVWSDDGDVTVKV